MNGLSGLAVASRDFAITSVIIACLVAGLMHALYNIGIQAFFQKIKIRRWIHRKVKLSNYKIGKPYIIEEELVKLAGGGVKSSFYSLPYEQLCGQIGSAIQSELEYPVKSKILGVFILPFGEADYKELLKGYQKNNDKEKTNYMYSKQRVRYYAEKGLDELQICLSSFWNKVNYLISFVISFCIICLLIITPNQYYFRFNDLLLCIVVGFASGLIAPFIREYFIQKINSK